jgi:hypothetical protein
MRSFPLFSFQAHPENFGLTASKPKRYDGALSSRPERIACILLDKGSSNFL